MNLRPYQQQAINECWQALKEKDEPVLLMASVGAGKSLIISDILLTLQKNNKVGLCLVNNAELVRNNCQTFVNIGGQGSIYCAALNSKDTSATIIFGTPQSILNGIIKNESIAHIQFNLIVVDEAHTINFNNSRSCFMRILRHYKERYAKTRLLGATGTNFRFRGSAIVGDRSLFRRQVGNITTEKLIDEGYLIEPSFEIEPNLVIDFSKVKVKQNGLFDQKQLSEVIDKNTRLTELICKQIVHIMQEQKRFGIFIFATTKKHAHEILSHLPAEESALILGETTQDERTKILEKARKGEKRYLVNISIISVGVDIPAYDTLAYLRPTESLVLLVQTLGRALRLSEQTHKKDALILDFAGNIERHKDWDNPLLLKAVAQTIDKDKPLVIQCPQCLGMNSEHARRCIGIVNEKRCDYYFEFKPCPQCEVKNDIASRHCYACLCEIIDPNAKLSLAIKVPTIEVKVLGTEYRILGDNRKFRVHCAYAFEYNNRIKTVFENFTPISEKAARVFYGQFVKKHCKDASKWYMHLHNRLAVEKMLDSAEMPISLIIAASRESYIIKKKIFKEAT